MKSRLLALCLLFVLLVALVPGTMAQDAANPICGNLSADDCTDLTTAFANTGTIASGAITFTSNLAIEYDDQSQTTKMDINADGKFSGATPISFDMAAISDNPAAAIGSLINGLKSFAGELNLTINLPASASMATDGKPLVINLLMVDGVSYVDFSKFPTSMTAGLAAYNTPNGWAGLDLVDVLNNIGPILLSNALNNTSSSTSSDLAKAQTILAKHLDYTRDGDIFTGEFDLVGILNDSDFQTLTNMPALSASDKAIVAALKDVTTEIVFTLAGDQLSEIQGTFDLPESVATAINATNPTPSTSSSKPPKSGSFTVDLKYSNLGEAQTISAPAGAPVTKFAELARIINDIYTKLVNDLMSATPTPAK